MPAGIGKEEAKCAQREVSRFVKQGLSYGDYNARGVDDPGEQKGQSPFVS